jgi:hypothetical protein
VSFTSFLALLGMFCFVVSIWLGVLTFTSDPANGAGCFVMAIAGAIFTGLARWAR